MEKLKVSQVAKMLGVSTQAVYKRLVTVGDSVATHLTKEKGITYLTLEGVSILKETLGNKPQMEVSPVGNAVATLENQVKEQKEIIGNQQHTIESLIFQQEESRKRTDTILMKLTTDISTLQKCLEYRKPEPIHQPAETITRMNPQKEKPPARSAPTTQSQVSELSLWESVQITVNNLSGFLFGRG
jgi:hypothetical protein